MKENKRKKRVVLKPWVRVGIMLILILLFMFSAYNIYRGYNPSNDNVPTYSYNRKSNIDYKVYLNKNDFYTEKYMEKDKQYPSELIQNIDVDFGYVYKGSLNSNMNYIFDVTATIIGEDKNENKEIWNKEYILLEKQNKILYDRDTFDINQNIKIDYQTFNKVVNDYKQKFNLDIDSYLSVKFNVEYNNELTGFKGYAKDKDTLELRIPLNKQTFNISTNYNKNKTNKLSDGEISKKGDINLKIGFIVLGVTIILSVLLIPQIYKSSKKDAYLAELKKLMKAYKDDIVEVETEFNYEDLEILDIKTFDDMLDISKKSSSPILCYKMDEEETWFVVPVDKYLYRYILSR